MITSEKIHRSTWCPHVRAIAVDIIQPGAIGPAGAPGSVIGARPAGAPLLMQISGNKGGKEFKLPNACMGRMCSQWAWKETVWDYQQRTGAQFDPALIASAEPSDRLGYCGLTNGGEGHSKQDQLAMIEAHKRATKPVA